MQRQNGFTLVELMIVVAIVGILASIAYPSYREYVLRSHRNAAQACLMEMTQLLERNRSSAMRYDQDSGGNAINDASLQIGCVAELANRYTFSFAAGPTALTYQLQAVPQGPQTGDSCATLTLNQAGVEGAGGTDCW